MGEVAANDANTNPIEVNILSNSLYAYLDIIYGRKRNQTTFSDVSILALLDVLKLARYVAGRRRADLYP